MILTGAKIEEEYRNGRIEIAPFSPELLNPNSYNVRLGSTIFQYDTNNPIDSKFPCKTKVMEIPTEGIVLEPGQLYLGHTIEVIGSNWYVPLIGGRSSTGRIGLFVHITAPLGDIGYIGQWTLQLRSTVRVRLYSGQCVGQMIFVVPEGRIDLYKGKYQGSVGPQAYRHAYLHN